MMKDVMLDLETFGTRPWCAIRSIGAVVFDRNTGDMGKTFYRNITKGSCTDAGLRVEIATEDWWAKQAPEAQAALEVDQRPLREVVEEFNVWWREQNALTVWSQGAGFDPVIWETAARAVKTFPPWKFWNIRDTRTAYDLGGLNEKSIPRAGTAHNALEDALHQALCVFEAVKKMRSVKNE